MEKNQAYKAEINPEFSVNLNISQAWTMNDVHFHDAFEIYYSLTEGIKYFVEGRLYDVSVGDLFIFNNMDLHRTIVPPGIVYKRYLALFAPEYIQDFSTPYTDLLECFLNRGPNFAYKIHLEQEQSDILVSLFNKAEHFINSAAYGSDIHRQISLAEILLYINSLYRSANLLPSYAIDGAYKKVRPIISHIHQHLDEDLSLENLARIFLISKYHMGCLFKKVTGFSVNEYIINRRVLKACNLLIQNVPVYLVCEKCGFNNYSHFIRTFKKLVGISPKQYVKRSVKKE